MNSNIKPPVGNEEEPAEYKRIDEIRTSVEVSLDQRYQALANFTDGQPFDENRYIKNVKDALQHYVLNGIKAGKYLLVLKEMLPHGKFMQALEKIDITPRSANNYMRVAFRFAGLSDEIKEELGMSKLYKMLQAPPVEIQRLETEGEFLSLKKEDMIQMSAKELSTHVHHALAKAKLDLDEERIKSDLLFKEKQQLAKDKERLERELLSAKNGQPPEKPLPLWWNEQQAAVGALMALSTKLAAHLPDLSDPNLAEYCFESWQRLSTEMAHVNKYLQTLPVDPVASGTAVRHKVAQLNNDSRFNFDLLNNDD